MNLIAGLPNCWCRDANYGEQTENGVRQHPRRDAVIKAGATPEWIEAEGEEKRGQHTTNGFWLGKHPVTQAEWQALTGDNPSHFQTGGSGADKVKGLDTSRFPVESVSWNDCQTFLEKLNAVVGVAKVFGGAGKFVLPHEDEWEYACRGGLGNKRPFYWGDSLNGTEANCNGDYPFGMTTKGPSLKRTCAVDDTGGGMYAIHPWGLHHMHGNVWEWCGNEYSKDRLVVRGGSWNYAAQDGRAAFRTWCSPNSLNSFSSFRVCLRAD